MSMTTTSASSLTAIARATVAPTLPAPPMTATLRFIRAPIPTVNPQSAISHILDDCVGELRRLQLLRAVHQSRQIIGDPLLLDGCGESLGDQRAGFLPAEVIEHHDAR